MSDYSDRGLDCSMDWVIEARRKNLEEIAKLKPLTDKEWNMPSYINYLNEELEKLKRRTEEAEKIIRNLSIEVNEHINS